MSNNKRSREEDICDNNSDINNSDKNNNSDNSNKKIRYKQFKKYKSKQYLVEELKDICNQLNLSKIGTKQQLYERIESHLKIKSSLHKELKRNRNGEEINSFNKYRPQLSITDGIENLELLFWTIFRSKFIFRTIFSNFKCSISHRYEYLDYVPKILSSYSNGIEIIMDKVKCSSNLIFIERNPVKFGKKETLNEFELIYNSIRKASDFERYSLFYNQLFRNYSRHFIFQEKSIQFILDSGNVIALLSFIKVFSISIDRIKSIVNHYFKKSTLQINTYNKLKLFYKLYSNNLLPPQMISIQFNHFDFNFISSLKLKSLIKICKIFSNFNIIKDINNNYIILINNNSNNSNSNSSNNSNNGSNSNNSINNNNNSDNNSNSSIDNYEFLFLENNNTVSCSISYNGNNPNLLFTVNSIINNVDIPYYENNNIINSNNNFSGDNSNKKSIKEKIRDLELLYSFSKEQLYSTIKYLAKPPFIIKPSPKIETEVTEPQFLDDTQRKQIDKLIQEIRYKNQEPFNQASINDNDNSSANSGVKYDSLLFSNNSTPISTDSTKDYNDKETSDIINSNNKYNDYQDLSNFKQLKSTISKYISIYYKGIEKPVEYTFLFKSKRKVFNKLHSMKLRTQNYALQLFGSCRSQEDQLKLLEIEFKHFYNEICNWELLEAILKTQDPIIIKAAFKIKQFKSFTQSHLKEIIQLIENPEIIQVYHKYFNDVFFIDKSYYWQYVVSVPVIREFEKYMKQNSKKFICSQFYKYDSTTCENSSIGIKDSDIFILKLLERAVRKPSIYIINHLLRIDSFSPLITKAIEVKKYDQVFKILELFHQKDINLSKLYNILCCNSNFILPVISKGFQVLSTTGSGGIKLISDTDTALFNNINNSSTTKTTAAVINTANNSNNNNNTTTTTETTTINNSNSERKSFGMHSRDYILLLCFSGRFNEIQEFFKSKQESMLYILKNPHLNLPRSIYEECIIHSLENPSRFKEKYIHELLILTAKHGSIPLFQFFINQFNIQIKKCKSITGWLSYDRFFQYTRFSIKYGHLELTEYLSTIMKLSRQDFDSICIKNSFIYANLKDKFK